MFSNLNAIQQLYYTVRNFIVTLFMKLKPASDDAWLYHNKENSGAVLANAIYVYDKLDENSMFAAALLRRYGGVNVYDIGIIDQIEINPVQSMVWLGFIPPRFVMRQYRNHPHQILLLDSETRTLPNTVIIYSGEHSSIAELVITHILSQLNYRNLPLMSESEIEFWSGIGFIVSQYSTREPGYVDGINGIKFDKKTRVLQGFNTLSPTATAFWFIKMASRYLTYGDGWMSQSALGVVTDTEIMDSYMTAVSETKAMLSLNSFPVTLYRGERLVVAREVDALDYHWYIARRMHLLNNQVMRTSRVLSGDSYYVYSGNGDETNTLALNKKKHVHW